MHNPYAKRTTRNATRAETTRLIAAYLANGGTVKRYQPGARAYSIAAINQAVITGRKPQFYCIHNPIATGGI